MTATQMMRNSRTLIRTVIRYSAGSSLSLMNGSKVTPEPQESSGILPSGYMTVCAQKPDIRAVTAA